MSKLRDWLQGKLSILDEKLNFKPTYYEVHAYYPDSNTEIYRFPEEHLAIRHGDYLTLKRIAHDIFQVTVDKDIKTYRRIWK